MRIAHGALLILPQAEWDAELDALLSDLTPPGGANAGRVDLYVREDAVHYASWCRLFAVYGEEFTRERTNDIGPDGCVVYKNPTLAALTAKLRATRAITDARTFRLRLERYVDSSNEVEGGSYWPIVKMVRAYSRTWLALRSGALLAAEHS